jgi:glycyl-tRNA synthetase beta chain
VRKPLFIELGCEEIPARMVESLAGEFARILTHHLNSARVLPPAAVAEPAWTPRRLICLFPEVLEHQPENVEQILGPAARIAFTPDGKPAPAGEAFAAKHGAAPSDLIRVATPKGEYVALHRKSGGCDCLPLLPGLIAASFAAMPLPRSMRWEGDLRFVRPLRWILALFGGQLVPVRIGALEAKAESRGHRTLGAAAFPVSTCAEYPALWRDNFVLASPADRRAQLDAAVARVLPPGLRRRADAALEDTLLNLTEWPDAVLGGFDAAYLETIPAEVLVTVMRGHQKYFAVEDAAGGLAPHFVAVINQRGDAQGLIRHGNERVLRARFSDARFFFEHDRKTTLAQRLPLLDQVTFQARLGSYRQKSLRMRALAEWLASQWPATDANAAAQAAELAKCDLTTDMVKELPELQGVMGGHYARAEGLPESIAEAIADQYLWEQPPRSNFGAAVSLADKLDTIVGMFAIGDIPTGSADPFGLRRLGNGVVRTLIERELPLSLAAAQAQARAAYGSQLEGDPGRTSQEALHDFFRERLAFYLRETAGFAPDRVAAVLAANGLQGSDFPLDAFRRCRALAQAPDLAAVAAVVKRARSIVRKEKWTSVAVDPARLQAPAEQALHQAIAALPQAADNAAGYAAELHSIAALAAPLERFFTEVRVNDDDPALRANRLSLLAWTVTRLTRLADFSELQP